MDIENAKNTITILERLAKGLDPFTNEKLDSDSVLENIKVVRALYLAVSSIKSQFSSDDYFNNDRPLNYIKLPENTENTENTEDWTYEEFMLTYHPVHDEDYDEGGGGEDTYSDNYDNNWTYDDEK